ncbi:MAG: DUF4160 domain-containing protein [Salinivirgaceae bacterium]|nr:DUF4160 domain-containing protein [Salinivirgaceae bacterium]
MPEIFRFYGFIFYFFSNEHDPIHVHVRGKNGNAKFNLCEGKFVLQSSDGIKMGDLKKIDKVIRDNTQIIIQHWHKYFDED